MKKEFTIDQAHDKLRLDLYLALNLAGVTRSFIKKQIAANQVKINGAVEYKANYRVKTGDKIIIEYEQLDQSDNILAEDIPVKVVYEDDSLLVVNKPEGMVVHPATGNYEGTLVNALLYKYKNIKDVGERIRAGLINRIDKDTSGLVFVGKTNEALWFYSRQFANRQVHKTYLAIVKGDFGRAMRGEKYLKLTTYMDRNPVKRKKFAVVKEGKGRIAVSRFEMVAMSKDQEYSLVQVSPETGRTHQIRVHLSYIGYPILGDVVYSGDKASRLYLHAYGAKVGLLSGKELTLTAPVSGSFAQLLKDNFEAKYVAKYLQDKK